MNSSSNHKYRNRSGRRRNLKRFVPLAAAAILVSCECQTYKTGFVLDEETRDPIEGAQVEMEELRAETSKNGFFMIKDVTGKCPDGPLQVTKEGYKPFRIEINGKGDYTTYRVQDRTEYRTFDEPTYVDGDSARYSIGEWTRMNSAAFTAITPDSLIIFLVPDGR